MAYSALNTSVPDLEARLGDRAGTVTGSRKGDAESVSPDDHRRFSAFSALRTFLPLWPLVLGLAFGRAGLIVLSYGSYTHTDEGIFTDGATLASLVVMAVLALTIVLGNLRFHKRRVNRLMRACIAFEALTLFTLAILHLMGLSDNLLRFLVSAFGTLVSSAAIWYWLRRARGCSTTTAAVFVFSALFVSEIEIYVCAMVPITMGYVIAAILVLMQLPCMVWSRTRTQPFQIESPTQATDYFGFAKTALQSTQFLTATAIGVGCLSVVIGFLRGYPNGDSVAFTCVTRVAYGLLTMIICVAIIALVLHERQRIMTVGIFLLMEFLACWALVLYAAFPGMLDIGAVFTTTLNAVMVAFTWYVVIAFMSYGWREPYYYAIAGWMVYMGARALSRIALIEIYQLALNDLFMNAFMGGVLVISTQVIFMQFLGISKIEQEDQEGREKRAGQKQSALSKLMALDGNESFSDVRQVSMQHNAEEMGRQYLLSDREIEVLTLYALGFTQKRVAEELYITPGTAHTHIKRIYAKTGLHSRQEILDYMDKYTS